MKTKWEDFAQRRKIGLQHFEGMNYDDYVFWCGQRNVIPVAIDKFQLDEDESNVESVPAKKQESAKFIFKDLNKYKKSKLLELCAENRVKLEGNETKKILIKKLLAL